MFFSLFFCKVWPIHFHFLLIIVIATSSCPVLAHSKFLIPVMTSGQKVPSIWRSLLFAIVCSLESRVLVRRQVSDPYRTSDLTLELNILNFVLRERALAFQTALRHAKACCAFLMLAVTRAHYAAKVSEIVCLLDVFIPSIERDAISSLDCHSSVDLKSYSCRCTLECHHLLLHVLKSVA